MIFSPSTCSEERDGALPPLAVDELHRLGQVVRILIEEVMDTPIKEILQTRRYRVQIPHHGIGELVGVLTELIHRSIAAGETIARLATAPAVDECQRGRSLGEGTVGDDERLREVLLGEEGIVAHG